MHLVPLTVEMRLLLNSLECDQVWGRRFQTFLTVAIFTDLIICLGIFTWTHPVEFPSWKVFIPGDT